MVTQPHGRPPDQSPPSRDAPGTISVFVPDPQPGLQILGYARALGLGGGLASRPTAESRILGPVASTLGERILRTASPESAEVLLHPHDALLNARSVESSLAIARNAGLPVALFSGSDIGKPSPGRWRLLWRTSGYASRIRDHERVAPGEVPDLIDERPAGEPASRSWTQTPSIGFIGHVATGFKSAAYLRHGWEHWYGFTLRERVLRAFEGSAAVETRFVRRSQNLGPPGTGVDADAERRKMRREYVDSVFGTDYSLCVRGAGNWSFRFFETLAAGRIPVLIDTDSVLPGGSEIGWDRHICRIPLAMLPQAAQMVADFHSRIGPDGFRAMQAANRALWLELLSPASFLTHALRQTIRDADSPGRT